MCVVVVRRVADAEGRDGLRRDAAAGEVLARARGLGGLELGLEVLRRGLVEVDQLAAQAGCSPCWRASSGELNSRLGSGMPALVATARTASGKLRPPSS